MHTLVQAAGPVVYALGLLAVICVTVNRLAWKARKDN